MEIFSVAHASEIQCDGKPTNRLHGRPIYCLRGQSGEKKVVMVLTKVVRMEGPATDISAPESGRTSRSAEPFREAM